MGVATISLSFQQHVIDLTAAVTTGADVSSYKYDAQGNRSFEGYKSGGTTWLQSTTDYKPNVNNSTVWTSTYAYDANGHLTSVDIVDCRSVGVGDGHRQVNFIADAQGHIIQRDESDDYTSQGDPRELHYYFNGMQVGDVGNNGTSDIDYAASIGEHGMSQGTGPFRNGLGSSYGLNYADFDQSYDPINGLTYENTSSRYTVQSGDTLQTIAYSVWGDSSFWYMIADANGLDGSETLTEGVDLIIPNKVHNSHNTSDVYRVYDPNEAIGNTSPTAAKPPKHQSGGGCGIMGQILLAVIAVVVAWYLAPLLVPALGTTLAGAVAGAAGSIVSQGVGLATGIQSKFDWGAVAMAAIGGGVQGAMAPGGLFGKAGAFSGVTNTFVQGFLRGATASVLTQGIGVATGLQRRFDWAGGAAAGVGQGVSSYVSSVLPGHAETGTLIHADGSITQITSRAASFGNLFVSGAAGLIANAATRTLVNGSDFGDNIISALPDFIAQTVGNALSASASAYDASDGGLKDEIPIGTSHPDFGAQIGGAEGLPEVHSPGTSVTIGGVTVDGNAPYKQPSVEQLTRRFTEEMKRLGATNNNDGTYTYNDHTYSFDPHYVIAQTFYGPNGTELVNLATAQRLDTLADAEKFLDSTSVGGIENPDGQSNRNNGWHPLRAETANNSPTTIIYAGAVDLGGSKFQVPVTYSSPKTATGTNTRDVKEHDYLAFVIQHEHGHFLFYAATSGKFGGTELQMDTYGLFHTPGVSVPSDIGPEPIPGFPPGYDPSGH